MSIYARVKTFKNKDGSHRDYVYLVESVWDKNKKSCRQRNICNLGRVDGEDTKETIANLLMNLSKYTDKIRILDICKDIDTKTSKVYGEILILKKLWKDLNFEKILKKYFKESRKEKDLTEAIFALVSNRIIDPHSKLGTYKWKETVHSPEWDKYGLHDFYRAMDFLIAHKEIIEQETFYEVKDLFNLKVNVVMFDTTTVSYWGKGKKAEDLLAYGYAKNKRFDLKQLVIGVIMDQSGFPLGHEVWEGNKSDKPAFKEIIDKVREKYEIDKVILVADRGMVSEENIKYLEEKGYEYILGVKMRKISKQKREILLSDDGFKELPGSLLKAKELTEKELCDRVKKLKNKDNQEETTTGQDKEKEKEDPKLRRRWIVCFNQLVANEDEVKREYFKKILENKVEFRTAKDWIVKNGYKKYVIIENMEIRLNEDKLLEEEIYDGKWVLVSNSTFAISNVIDAYKGLSKIERHFRCLKSELEVGPLFHQTEIRIKGHIFICFMALQLKAALTMKLKELSEDISYSQVMRDVANIKAVEYIVKDRKITTRTDFDGMAYLAFNAVKLPIPNKIISNIELQNHVPTNENEDLFALLQANP